MTTRIAVLSDIHGHLAELKTALKHIETLNVDAIVCCGDLVDRGPDSLAVLDFMRAQGIPTVRGNHDDGLYTQVDYIKRTPELRQIYSDAAALSAAQLDYLKQLPMNLQFSWEGVTVTISHATPWSITTYITPHVLSRIAHRVMTAAGTDVVLLGHTHEPMRMRVGDGWIFNSGAIGDIRGLALRYAERSFGVLELPAKTFTHYNADDGTPFTVPVIKHPPKTR
jgi:putative phosphoesterase